MFQIAAALEVATCAGAGLSAFYYSWLNSRSSRGVSITPKVEPSELCSLRSRYGYNEHSLIGSSIDSEIWVSADKLGAIAYTESGGIWMIAGEPFAAETDLVRITHEFISHARALKKTVAFLPATERFARAVASDDVRIVKIGASPYFDLTTWNPRGNSAKHLRTGVNRGRRAGLTVTEVTELTPAFRAEVDRLVSEWGGKRRAGVRFGWLFELMPFQNAEFKKFFAAHDAQGRLVGVLAASPIPARDGWYLEDVIRGNDAPDGTSDILVFETLKALATSGAKIATLGTVPLSTRGDEGISCGRNRAVEAMLDLSRKQLKALYNFDGLGHFKSKFVPTWWENEYVVVTKGHLIPPRVANALFNIAIPGGIGHVLLVTLTGATS
jgi:phosphatidylglycerol lysyltransferase